jgi:aminomethyltransferase
MPEPASTSSEPGPHRSPLHDRHVALGAKLAAFGGWSMPLEYAGGGVVKEHLAVREEVGCSTSAISGRCAYAARAPTSW